jgi:hypothetical protein
VNVYGLYTAVLQAADRRNESQGTESVDEVGTVAYLIELKNNCVSPEGGSTSNDTLTGSQGITTSFS